MHSSVKNESEIAAIVLAAGGSHRFGSPKQLLPWRDDNLVNTVISLGHEAQLSPLILVLGASAEDIHATVKGEDVQVCLNKHWQEGQSTSLKAGLTCLEKLAPHAIGTLFFLVDQPQTPVALIEAIKKMAFAGADIVLPMVGELYANPVYFSRRCFAALQGIRGDQGGRAIFGQFPVTAIEWQDSRQAMDIDTPEDYLQLRRLYGINDGLLV